MQGLELGRESAAGASARPDPIDHMRAREYDLLASLLGRVPSRATLASLAQIEGDASPLGKAHGALATAAAAKAATQAAADAVSREFFALFVGLGRGELLPYASYYLTGFLYSRPLARLREDLARLGVERAGSLSEPEDHVAILLETMAGLAAGRFAAEKGAEQRFFERHLEPWAARFFADLESAGTADFYRAVGALGRLFMEIETEAFAMAA